MPGRNIIIYSSGQVICLVGILSGALLSAMFMWVNLEHYLFGFYSFHGEALRNLKCPLIMTKSEIGKIRVRITNNLDRTSEFTLRADFSTSTGEIESTRSKESIDVGKTQQYE